MSVDDGNVQEEVKEAMPPLLRLARTAVNLPLTVSQVYATHVDVVELDCQRASYSCPGAILVLPLDSGSLAGITDGLDEVDVLLVLPNEAVDIAYILRHVLTPL